MTAYLEAFLLGNAAILGNVCMVPLYPGMVAFLAGTQATNRPRHVMAWLGVCVLAGILSVMLAVGFVVFLLQQSLSRILPVLLPLLYLAVIGFGIAMLFDRNPFTRLAQRQIPVLGNPYASAYLYGVCLGPMTLPCTGPLIVSAFLLGVGDMAALADGLAYFFVFGLGFGWPLVLLPLLAAPFQRQLTRWSTRAHSWLTRGSGALLIAIGLFGLVVEVLPNW